MSEQNAPQCDPGKSNQFSPVPHIYRPEDNDDGVETMVCIECGRRVHPKGTW